MKRKQFTGKAHKFKAQRRDRALRISVIWSGLALTCSAANAQAVYGSLVGTVTDPSGAAVPNATVQVLDVAKGTSVTAVTNESGQYTVQHLIPDTYNVSVNASGFGASTTNNVQVFADTSPKVDVKLELGTVQNEVTVSSGVPLLQTDRSEISTILNARAVETLPNLNRNFTAFELLTPGTTYIGWNVSTATNPQRSQQIEVNGQLPFATGYELDGTDNQEPVQGVAVINPNLDAVSEMKVTSQNYNAELGKAVAGLVTAQTKSGSNAFHGSAFEFRRTDAQQARDPFAQYNPDTITGRYIPSNTHNQFGGSIGGPIKRDKIFFFGDYQGLREKTGSSVTSTVPTLLAHNTCVNAATDCNLSDYINPAFTGIANNPNQPQQLQLYDPAGNQTGTAGRAPFAGNIIPAARVSPQARALLALIPLPTDNTKFENNYVSSATGAFNTDQADLRVDAGVTQKLHIFGRYTYFSSNIAGPGVFGAAGGNAFGSGLAGTDTARDQSVAAGGDMAVSSKWLTDFRVGWFRVQINEEGLNYNQPLGTQLGIPGINQGDLSLNGGLPQFNIIDPTGSNTLFGTSANQYDQIADQFQVTNNWTRLAGKHTIKFGADLRYALNHLIGLDNNNVRAGNFSFAASRTAGQYIDASSTAHATSGLGYGTFLLGDVTEFRRTETANVTAAERQKRTFFYAQDEWRLTNTLTLNYGLRYEIYFPETVNGPGNGGLLNLNTGNIQVAGHGPYGLNMGEQVNVREFAPRVGLAWQVHPETVFRAGYGRVYGMGWSGNTFGEVTTFSYPVQVSQDLTAPTQYARANASAAGAGGITLATGPTGYTFPALPSSGNYALPDGVSVPTRPINQRLPTLDAWNAAIQQQLTHDSSMEIAYVASHAIHNMFDSSNQMDPNEPTVVGFPTYSPNQRRPYYDGTAQTLGVTYGSPFGWTQSLRYNANLATSSYQALQIKYQKNFSHGFQILTHYTWSHSRAHESDYYLIDPRVGYGNSYYNRRNVYVATGNWDLPFGQGKLVGGGAHGFVNQLISNYSINGTATIQSGLPYTPSYNECSADRDTGPCRPSFSGGALGLGGHALNTSGSSPFVQFFQPVAPLATNGAVSGGYARPAVATFGNIQRDALFGPGYWSSDASFAKAFNLKENVKFQLRAEAFNLLNHANYNNPNSTVDVASGGQITSTVGTQDGTSMRRLQFAARFDF